MSAAILGCRFAYLDFSDENSFNKALELNGVEVGGYPLTVGEAKPRGDSQFSSGGRGDRSGGRGRGRGRDGGRFSGGRGRGGGGRFGGGRGRGTPNKPNLAAAGTGTFLHTC